MIEYIVQGISAIIVTYLIIKDKFTYPSIFINTIIIGVGLQVLHFEYWKLSNNLLINIFVFALIGYGTIYGVKSLGENIISLNS
ncbi:unnamed protein product [marine sediment metagenome]|uniref:Uncharacterized protein n=1 Tax=marine sediment metagenome TaxID=412755 RepID=X1SUM7_9ZZZZ